ncbi:MAG: hypothetical protein JO129_03195 [Candidatus Dependentiae bacterium]|nr:hypothetical protein [Candidatus Dependentiae bacterium]
MILKNNRFLFGALFLCLPSLISANITTLQSWDPIPFFNAANLNMPPDTPFCYEIKNRMLDRNDEKVHHFGINISPFVQKAIRAQQSDNLYFGVSGTGVTLATVTPGLQMGDYQGTAYLMGLFLGQDVNGNSIWGGPTATDTGVVTNITTATVNATLLPAYLKDAVNALNDNADASGSAPGPNAILFYTPTNSADTSPSILSQSVLEQDQTYFGAFSMPLTYQKSGFRWEVNFDICDDLGVLIRGGFCQITQRVTLPIPLSGLAPVIQQSSGTNSPAINGIFNELNTVANAKTNSGGSNVTAGIPVPLAQATFNEWVQNNVDDLLDPEFGANYNIQTFSETGIEDIQFLAFFRHPFLMHPVNPDRYASIIVTPYFMVGATAPIAPIKDYSKLYALPFGNNGHISVGGVVGTTFDFMDKIEFGFEFGATGFIKQTIDQLPLPNHELQRVLYPYRQNVIYQPGFNGQFAAIFNAYEFIRNISFSFRYNYVQHTQDTITMVTPSPYFFPIYLEELTPWNSQMFIAALTFKIQSNIYLSAAWQGALSQKNAYCSNTILASLNFLF